MDPASISLSLDPVSAAFSVIQYLSGLLYDHVKLRSGVKDKIRSLRGDLQFMDAFLKSSEGKRNDHMVKVVVEQISEVAHNAENVIDTYVANVILQRSRNSVKKLFHCTSHELMLRDVDAEIENIKSRIEHIYNNRDRYGIERGVFQGDGADGAEKEAAELLRKRRQYVEEEEVVGLVHDSGIVIGHLLETSSRLNVVSIVGMGGLGKTTLARKIYNKKEVHDLFPCRAWGYVSNDCRVKELLLSFLKCLLSTSEYNDLFMKRDDGIIVSEDEEEMKQRVKNSLRGKKYLIVLDDIWKTEVWDDIGRIFPDDNNGSRILITSRIEQVALYTGSAPPYDLPFLNEEDSWVLFSNKVFRGENCPSYLEDLGMSMVKGCGGLPLAIIVLAGLAAKKGKSQTKWEQIKKNVRWHLAEEDRLKDILKLSYNNLPPKFRPCFLYFGIYPEDYQIYPKDLMRMWIAEGFIQPPKTGTPDARSLEDIAESYLDELVDRNMVQVSSRKASGSVNRCQIHDLLRDLCISEGKVGEFLEVVVSHDQTLSNSRRLSVHCPEMFFSSSNYSGSCARSLLLFGEYDGCPNQFAKNFKSARVLYSSEATLRSSISDLKRMVHLRYLKTKIINYSEKRVSLSLSNLWNLETLEILGESETKNVITNIVIRGIWELKQLRHVSVNGCVLEGMSRRADRKPMWNLQTLSLQLVEVGAAADVLNNGSFPGLRKLFLSFKIYSSGKELQGLRYPSNLCKLRIWGYTHLPLDPNVFPSNLTSITLAQFKVMDDSCMKTLGKLTNLQILKLKFQNLMFHNLHTVSFFELNCAAGEFPELQSFHMVRVKVKSWKLEEGAMPYLQHLFIDGCYYLKKLPEQLWSLSTLRQVHVGRSSELATKLQNVEVKNGCKLIIS